MTVTKSAVVIQCRWINTYVVGLLLVGLRQRLAFAVKTEDGRAHAAGILTAKRNIITL